MVNALFDVAAWGVRYLTLLTNGTRVTGLALSTREFGESLEHAAILPHLPEMAQEETR